MDRGNLLTALALSDTLEHLPENTPIWLESQPGTVDPLLHARSEQLASGQWVIVLSTLEHGDI